MRPEDAVELLREKEYLRGRKEAYEDAAVTRALEGWSPAAVRGEGALSGMIQDYEQGAGVERSPLPKAVSETAHREALRVIEEKRRAVSVVVEDTESENAALRREAATAVRVLRLRGAIEEMYSSQSGRCWYCRCELGSSYHVDHKTPISRGGDSNTGNLCCACRTCNIRKNAMTETEFRASGKFTVAFLGAG